MYYNVFVKLDSLISFIKMNVFQQGKKLINSSFRGWFDNNYMLKNKNKHKIISSNIHKNINILIAI